MRQEIDNSSDFTGAEQIKIREICVQGHSASHKLMQRADRICDIENVMGQDPIGVARLNAIKRMTDTSDEFALGSEVTAEIGTVKGEINSMKKKVDEHIAADFEPSEKTKIKAVCVSSYTSSVPKLMGKASSVCAIENVLDQNTAVGKLRLRAVERVKQNDSLAEVFKPGRNLSMKKRAFVI